jgi:hypothetical protein
MLDNAEIQKDKAIFECDVAKKEKMRYIDLYN